MKKRLILLSFFILTCIMSWGQVYQKDDKITIGNIIYAVTNNDQNNLECSVYECNATGDVVIPATIKDTKGGTGYTLKVTSTDATAFRYKKSIQSVVLPEGLTTINLWSFNDCSVLAVYLPSTLTDFDCTNVTSTMAKIVVASGNETFYTNTAGTALMKKVKVGDVTEIHEVLGTSRTVDVTTDGTSAFTGNWTPTYLETVKVPEGVTYIDASALKNSYSINGTTGANPVKTVTLPSTLTGFDPGCWGDWRHGWHDIKVASGNSHFKDCDGILYTVPGTAEGTYWTDTETGEKYGTTLVKVPVSRYHDKVSDKTFTVTIPDGVKTISEYAFRNTEMYKVVFSESVETICDNAFTKCEKLTTVSLGKNVSSVKSTTFTSCSKLTDIFVDQENPIYTNGSYDASGVGDGILFGPGAETTSEQLTETPSLKWKHLMTCPTAKTESCPYDIPSTCYVIDEQAFTSSSLTAVNMGENVDAINKQAFYQSKLKAIDLGGKKVTILGDNAFQTTSLTKVVLGASVKRVGSSCFGSINNSCNITDFTWENTATNPSQCTYVASSAFTGVNVETFTFPESVETVRETVLNKTNVKNVVFADDLGDGSHLTLCAGSFTGTSIETVDFGTKHKNTFQLYSTFKGSTSLETVSLPKECTRLTNQTFMDCTGLEHVYFGENSQLTTIGTGIFANTGLLDITLPDNLEQIQTGAFKGCTKLVTVNIPSTVANSIHPLSFQECSSLTSINVIRGNTTYATSDGMLCNKAKTKLIIYPNGKVSDKFNLLTPSLTEIGEYAFYGATNLKSIVIPKKVSKIGNYAFYLCNALTDITFLGEARPSSVDGDVATDNKKSDDNQRDHRFGYDKHRGATYLSESVTIHARKGAIESFKESGSYWAGAKGTVVSFDAASSVSGRSDVTNTFEYLSMDDQGNLGIVKSNSTCNTAVVPTTATYPTVASGEYNESLNGTTHNVLMVADYAFEDMPSTVKEMVFLGPIDYIGANAFNNGHKDSYTAEPTSSIENIFFANTGDLGANTISTARFGLNSNAKAKALDYTVAGNEAYGDWGTEYYPEFAATQKVYVPKSKLDTYKNAWLPYAADTENDSQIRYQIPLSMSGTFGTLSREFDVDLRDGNGVITPIKEDGTESDCVIAFTGRVDDGSVTDAAGNVVIRMRSINCDSEKTTAEGTDGTYIPANTGVLLRKYGNGISYYRIGEQSVAAPSATVFQPVVENALSVSATDNYYMASNGYVKLTDAKTMPVHKAYFTVAGSGSAKGIKFVWGDEEESETNGIDAVETADNAESVIYDLSGRRVSNTAAKQGVYVVNGKKMFIK